MVVEGVAQTKSDEHHPLLMVAGAGDATVRAPNPVNAPWSTTTTCTVPSRPQWKGRLPEYLSTCWMTFILLGISFLVFYAVGMVVIYRHESYVLVKCNETKTASNVYYHTIIPNGSDIPLGNYADYLASMASRYPQLKFNLYFLVDEKTRKEKALNYNNLYGRLHQDPFNDELQNNKQELIEFKKKYANINISVMSLCKYMSMTPLKYRWRTIPAAYLPFYARVFAVWSNGGIGLDLNLYNEQYKTGTQLRSSRKVDAILRQHNYGIVTEKYAAVLNKMELEEETEFFSTFFNMVQRIFNDTLSLFNNTIPMSSEEIGETKAAMNEPVAIPQPETLVRTHRAKRNILDQEINALSDKNTTSLPTVVNIFLTNTSVVNVTDDTNKRNVYEVSENEQSNKLASELAAAETQVHVLDNQTSRHEVEKLGKGFESISKEDSNKSEGTQIVLFYDFSMISDPIRPQVEHKRAVIVNNSTDDPPKYITLEAEGSFVAATSRKDPFLCTLISGGCKRLPPKLAIQNAILIKCSGPHKDETHCNNIYLL